MNHNNNNNLDRNTPGVGGGGGVGCGAVDDGGPSTSSAGGGGGNGNGGNDAFTVKRMMGRTPGLIKSKFLSVLDSSNGILNGISSKLEGLSLNSSHTTSDDIYKPQRIPIGKKGSYCKTDSSGRSTEAEDILIEIESRKLKERRAHDEIKSGRFRHPNILTKMTDGFSIMDIQHRPMTPNSVVSPSTTTGSGSSRSTTTNPSNATTTNVKSGQLQRKGDNGTTAAGGGVAGGGVVEETTASGQLKIDITAPSDYTVDTSQQQQQLQQTRNNVSCAGLSTLSTSEYDLCIPSSISCGGTVDDTTTDMWVRSESINSVPSWASTISLDSQSDESVIEFIRRFLTILFDNPDKISLELKSEFGQVARTEAGRLWFSRLVNAQRVKSKRVDESTFYSLIQYFAIVLFECHDCDDFSPAKSLMNMCFTFYHEICVPGIEPYREYLYLYLRDQPIWHSLRFWNAAFFDALQCERANKPIPSTRSFIKVPRKSKRIPAEEDTNVSASEEDGEDEDEDTATSDGAKSEILQGELDEERERKKLEIDDDQRFQQNITFGQLGTFTCNMHAFGLSRDLCLEFLRKQCTIANLSAEHEKLLKDNIIRMYRETDKWRTN